MKKLILILTAIHFSAFGNYLVDQDGNKVIIHGHPHMICYVGQDEIRGIFQKARGSDIYLIGYDTSAKTKDNHYFMITNPVCDIK